MKKLISLLTLCIFLVGCSTEEKLYTIKKQIKNSSEESFELILIGYSNDTILNQILLPQESTPIFEQTSGINSIMGWGDVATTIKIRFLNSNKGYECTSEFSGNKCFSLKGSPFEAYSPQNYTVKEDVYIYEITQEDYENAHVLE